MSTLWFVIIPEATENLIANPSFEAGTDGYAALAGGTLEQSSEASSKGNYSGKYTPTSTTTDGIKYDVTLDTTTEYTVAVSFLGANGVDYLIEIYDETAGSTLGTRTFTGDGTMKRFFVTATTGANASCSVRIRKDSDASTAAFYADALQLEEKGYPTTYCDGDQPGCLWNAGEHTSTSTREATTSEGGREVGLHDADLAGFKVTEHIGVGLPPMDVIYTTPAQQDGGDYQRTIIKPRQFQLIGDITGVGANRTAQRQNYHDRRQRITDIVSPHRLGSSQPLKIRYIFDGKAGEISAYYQGGLEKGQMQNPASEKVTLRMIALEDPIWTEVMGGSNGDSGLEDDSYVFQETRFQVSNIGGMLRRDKFGQWFNMGVQNQTDFGALTINGDIYALAVHPNGDLYLGGNFTTIDGVTMNGISRFDGVQFHQLYSASPGVSGTPRTVSTIIITPAGVVYLMGSFDAAGGVANTNKIASYDQDTDTFSAVGTGVTGTAIIRAGWWDEPNQRLYVGGSFDEIGGVATIGGASFWDGSWNDMDGGVTSGIQNVTAIEGDDIGDVYYFGQFDEMGSVANTQKVAKWDESAANFVSIATGGVGGSFATGASFDPVERDLWVTGNLTSVDGVSCTDLIKYDIDGDTWEAPAAGGLNGGDGLGLLVTGDRRLLIAGNFTSVGSPVVTNTANVAYLDLTDSQFYAMEQGANDAVRDFAQAGDGMIYASGDATLWSGAAGDGVARFTGQLWLGLGFPIQQMIQAKDGKIWAVGGFVSMSSVSNTAYVAYWDTVALEWVAVGTGADGVAFAIAEAPNGDIYIGGSFEQVGGVSNTQGIAYWDISTSTWQSIGDVNGTVKSLAFAGNGDLFLGGFFPDAGGVANTKNLAGYDGTNFYSVGEPNGSVNALARSVDGSAMYIGGLYTKIGSDDFNNIAKYTTSTATFSALGTGVDGAVNSIDTMTNGHVVLGGTFRYAGGTLVNFVALWTGSQFENMGGGTNGFVNVVYVERKTSRVYIGGVFSEAGGLSLPSGFAIWLGSSWVFAPVATTPALDALKAIVITPAGAQYLGFDSADVAQTPFFGYGGARPTNTGSAKGYPVITTTSLGGSGRLYEITNFTTGQSIYFDIVLSAGEEIIIDLDPAGSKSVESNFRGLLNDLVFTGSDLEDFYLVPGENNVGLFWDISAFQGIATFTWDIKHLGFDGPVAN